MKVRPDNLNVQQMRAFLDLRRRSLIEESRQSYAEFSKRRDLSDGTSISTIHVPAGFSISLDGGITSDKTINVGLFTYRGYLVANNTSSTYFQDGKKITNPLSDNYYEIVVPAEAKFQMKTGEERIRIIRAIKDAVEVSTTLPAEGTKEVLDDLILPILFDARVDLAASLQEIPENYRLRLKAPISLLVNSLMESGKLPETFTKRLNPSHIALIGSKHVRMFELAAA